MSGLLSNNWLRLLRLPTTRPSLLHPWLDCRVASWLASVPSSWLLANAPASWAGNKRYKRLISRGEGANDTIPSVLGCYKSTKHQTGLAKKDNSEKFFIFVWPCLTPLLSASKRHWESQAQALKASMRSSIIKRPCGSVSRSYSWAKAHHTGPTWQAAWESNVTMAY